MSERYYYAASISDFLRTDMDTIMGRVVNGTSIDLNEETRASWRTEERILKQNLQPYDGRGTVFFEYNIPRMGKRVDVVLVIDGVIFVVEFKTGKQVFTREALTQVWDYALDLKNFHSGSLTKTIVPILLYEKGVQEGRIVTLLPAKDLVYYPIVLGANQLQNGLEKILETVPHEPSSYEQDIQWARSGYNPTPTIIEAAVALYNEHQVDEITKHSGDVAKTTEALQRIVNHCRENQKKAICFVTGVPGAGKTLIGLQVAIDQFTKGEKAIFLSGNAPLVAVLQEALARDYVRRSKAEVADKKRIKPATKKEASSQVKSFIQIVHHYRDTYLHGLQLNETQTELVPKSGYFQSLTDSAYVPVDHIAIFDEAQRAWTQPELEGFMRKKKGFEGFPYSESEFLISCTERRQDWGVVIALIGGGQEINHGEAGIEEWLHAINRRFKDWNVYMSNQLFDRVYDKREQGAHTLIQNTDHLFREPDLHLKVSMRSFRAEKLSIFVNQLLELKTEDAARTLKELEYYPIVITRSLTRAKQWLKEQARGSDRYGMLASSKADRLKAIGINVRYKPSYVHWFLEDEDDVRSSNRLEDTLTEFEVQGLEVDWSCVTWDADLRLENGKWSHCELKSGKKWNKIKTEERQSYQLNAYRVLLTRARQGMVIVIPEGDKNDTTRQPEWYNGIYNYLKTLSIPEIK